MPGAGRKLLAWRLPKVMVPVLSISNTSMSPAASTARPEVAITLADLHALSGAVSLASIRLSLRTQLGLGSNLSKLRSLSTSFRHLGLGGRLSRLFSLGC